MWRDPDYRYRMSWWISAPAARIASTIATASAAGSHGVTATTDRPSHPGSSTATVVTPPGADRAAISGIRQMPSPAATSPNRAGQPRTV
jgi:hypothetical protein